MTVPSWPILALMILQIPILGYWLYGSFVDGPRGQHIRWWGLIDFTWTLALIVLLDGFNVGY